MLRALYIIVPIIFLQSYALATELAYVLVDRNLKCIDVDARIFKATVELNCNVEEMVVGHNNQRLYIAPGARQVVYVVDIATNQVLDSIATRWTQDIAITHDEKKLYSIPLQRVDMAKTYAIINLVTGDSLRGVSKDTLDSVVISPDGKYAYFSGKQSIAVLDIATDSFTNEILFQTPVTNMACSKRRNLLYALNPEADQISLVNLNSLKVESAIVLEGDGDQNWHDLIFNKSESLLIVNGYPRSIMIDVYEKRVIDQRISPYLEVDLKFTENDSIIYLTTSAFSPLKPALKKQGIPGNIYAYNIFTENVIEQFDLGFEPVEIIIVDYPKRFEQDFNRDGVVDFEDFFSFASVFNSAYSDNIWQAKFDLDGNGNIGFQDFLRFISGFVQSQE